MAAKLLYSVFCILYPISCFLYSVFYILPYLIQNLNTSQEFWYLPNTRCIACRGFFANSPVFFVGWTLAHAVILCRVKAYPTISLSLPSTWANLLFCRGIIATERSDCDNLQSQSQLKTKHSKLKTELRGPLNFSIYFLPGIFNFIEKYVLFLKALLHPYSFIQRCCKPVLFVCLRSKKGKYIAIHILIFSCTFAKGLKCMRNNSQSVTKRS